MNGNTFTDIINPTLATRILYVQDENPFIEIINDLSMDGIRMLLPPPDRHVMVVYLPW